eukprot:6685392-Pyramimonas_sp.AAC.1
MQGVHGRALRGGAQEGFPCEGSRGVREQGYEPVTASSLSCSGLLRETPSEQTVRFPGCLKRNKQFFEDASSETNNYLKDVSSEMSNSLTMSQAKPTIISRMSQAKQTIISR